jgi:hypothetical protein
MDANQWLYIARATVALSRPPKKHSPMPIFLSAIFLSSLFLLPAPDCQSFSVCSTPPNFAFSLFRAFAIKMPTNPAPQASSLTFLRIASNATLEQRKYFSP